MCWAHGQGVGTWKEVDGLVFAEFALENAIGVWSVGMVTTEEGGKEYCRVTLTVGVRCPSLPAIELGTGWQLAI